MRATVGWGKLKAVYEKAVKSGKKLALFDFDGHNSIAALGSFERILYNTKRKLGHAFVLAMLLTGSEPWEAPFDAHKVHATSIGRRR